MKVCVTDAPREGAAAIFEAEGSHAVEDAVDFLRRAGPASPRRVLWICDPPPATGPDLFVCVPLRAFADADARAASVLDAWEAAWLAIESLPRAHRDAARDELRGAVATALISAAITGVDPDVGF